MLTKTELAAIRERAEKAERERDAALAEVARMRPVVDAADEVLMTAFVSQHTQQALSQAVAAYKEANHD